MSKRPKCLVYGGSGFLGQTLCRQLIQSGFDVRSVSRSGLPAGQLQPWHHQVEWISSILGSEQSVAALDGIDIVYHLASSTYPSSSNLNMSFDLASNTQATLNILDAAVRLPIKRFVFISSGGTVYGIPQENPIKENHATNPICSYGIHKLAIEKYLYLYEHLHGLKSVILRVSNIYGEAQDCSKPLGAVAHFTHHALHGHPIEIWGDGTTTRDYIHVEDVVRALILAADYEGTHPLFNIGSGHGLSLNGLVDLIKQYATKPVAISYKPSRAFDVRENVLDIQNAWEHLSWKPIYRLDDCLRRIMQQ